MTYDQLVAFTTVASTGTFTAASARLHKSQPAVSKLVRNLEDELGVELFDRKAYRATLTAAGRLFFERATAVLESTSALASFGKSLAGALDSTIRLAIDAITPLGPLLATLRELERDYPMVRIELETERLSGAVDAVLDERVDLAIALLLDGRPPKLEISRYAKVAVRFVVRFDHPLALAGAPVAPALLRAHPQVILRDSSRTPDESASVNVLEGGLRWTVTDVAAKREVILAGMGWGGLPEDLVAEALSSGRLVALEIPEFEVETLELFALRRRNRPNGIVAKALWQRLTKR